MSNIEPIKFSNGAYVKEGDVNEEFQESMMNADGDRDLQGQKEVSGPDTCSQWCCVVDSQRHH